MINVRELKTGSIVKILVENKGFALNKGDTLRVIKTGYSNWDEMHYADCRTDKDYVFEIMKNYKDFELVC